MNERLAMIGKLAAGVAHELNNPLDGVLRYVNFAIRKLPEDAEQVTYLLQARQGLRRMADIVRDLLQFSRNANVDASDEDAERIARDAVEQVVQAAAPRPFTTTYEFPAGGCHVPRAVFQVIGNLAKNAVDAMPRGGRLRISGTVRNGRLRIAVADDGVGIPEEIRDRIFEPFFTTKEVGKGTGLGLSICQRIVERLGGTVELESEVGRGTTVTVDLPVRTARGAGALPVAAHTARPAGVRATAPSSAREGVF
jgi:signal transduction histidine kinase